MKKCTQHCAGTGKGYTKIVHLFLVPVVYYKALARSFAGVVILSFLFFPLCSAQTTSPAVIGVGGGQLTSDAVTVTWTVGEIAVARHFARDGRSSLTEGVHQPYIQVYPMSEVNPFAAQIFPNPVSSEFMLRLPMTLDQTINGRLVDGQGRILQEKDNVTGGDTRFDLRNLPVGVYYLHLRQTDDASRAGTYKVVKVNH